jgi:hypothetical protein
MTNDECSQSSVDTHNYGRRWFTRRCAAGLLAVAAFVTMAGIAVLPSAGTAFAAPAYHHYTKDFYTNIYSSPFVGRVHVQAGWRANGQTVYLDYLYATPEGYGISVTWQGATGGGYGNLTFGENEQWCIGPFGVGCFAGGVRVVVNTNGTVINIYQWGL